MSELASYEFGQVEGAFSTLDERALAAVLPQDMALDKFKSKLEAGEFVLLSDAPITPALRASNTSYGDKVWQVNPAAESHFSPQAKTAFVSRSKSSGFTSRSGSESQSAPDVPYTPEPKAVEKTKKPDQDYEYLFEIACTEAVLASDIGCQFALGKTPKEASIVSWQTKLSEIGTIFSAKATDDTPRRLIAKVAATEKGVSSQPPVKLKPKGTDAVREAFIPIVPAMQLGSRLGFPTDGYFYHFHEGKLVQEYKILGEGRWAFQATRSTHTALNTEPGLNKYQGAILLYWKIDSKVVTNQHLVHLGSPITREQLDNLNEDWLAENGVAIDIPALLAVIKTTTAAEKPYKPQTYNTHADVTYEHKERLLMGSTLKAINNTRLVESGLPVVNIRKVPEKTLRIGVFFDGTGNNLENDKYKEARGNASRTNIARLFEAYPEEVGVSHKIYVSGIGTVDFDGVPPSEIEKAIDSGEDMTMWSQMTGAQDFLIFSETGAHYKWQSLIKQLYDIYEQLNEVNKYNSVEHIEFDVFGFSRGAALARHFVNAALSGFPDYSAPLAPPGSDSATQRKAARYSVGIFPHLLSNNKSPSLNKTCHYHVDASKRVSVRFVGLFDTVGSFYLAGNNDDGEFKLGLEPDCAETVYHITAFHEYRKNFPLTSLRSKRKLPANFYEEVFPGAHADVGGGYPSIEQYNKQGLPDRYGMPMTDCYNRELVKTESVDEAQYYEHEILAQKGLSDSGGEAWALGVAKDLEKTWNIQCQSTFKTTSNTGDIAQHGHVRYADKTFYFYRLQPINNGLQGLAQDRMYEQAKQFGIKWEEVDYELPSDYTVNSELTSLGDALKKEPSGSITSEHWHSIVEPNITNWIHRPHDICISPGYHGIVAKVANKPNTSASGELKREIYDNA
ncbi:hypothetical protein A1OQ_09940 [Enterovibrio norvegicus FF-162]|uniref:DUF2235 domain-containing protein n=1 Tax=Enterovibrio norvegicus TaxID=188144 RepID=UPI00030409DA|nr:DUF2235 domain-containing protein [Enterovibrio norvegicus]OEE74150.1 hypothetical protein A1OQ_09940 [Enterovibrio norvegicus FF-162]